MIKLYHGTTLSSAINISENGIDLSKGKEYLDFGKGFYLTPDIDMAKNMVARSVYHADDTYGAVLTFELDEEFINKCSVKNFEDTDIEWRKFVFVNRIPLKLANDFNLFDHNIDLKYDVCIGATSDGKIASIARKVRNGNMNYSNSLFQDCNFLKNDNTAYSTQYSFHSNISISYLKYKCMDIIKEV